MPYSRIFLVTAILCAAFASFLGKVKADWSVEAMNKQIDATNFVVNRGCSGTLIDWHNKHILTANHCVENQYETVEREKIEEDGVIKKEKYRRLKPGTVRQIFFNGSAEVKVITYRTTLIAFSKESDLALLKVNAVLPQVDGAKIACTSPRRGEAVFIVGNPTGEYYASVVPGIVSSVQRDYGLIDFPNDDQAQPLMQVSGGIVGGNSGGAVYNDKGELVGVPVLGHRLNEVLGFAVPLDQIKAFLKTNKLEGVIAHCAP